jgi:cation transport ATPase
LSICVSDLRPSRRTLARAIIASASKRGLELPPAADFRAIPGHGAEARVDGRTLQVGGPNLLRKLNAAPPIAIPLAAGVLSRQGILLPPAAAAVLMSPSTVLVAVNAQLLRRQKI